MSKNIKTITKILITILIVIGVLLSLPKTEDAESVDYSVVIGRNGQSDTIEEVVKNGVSFYGQDMFMNKNIYCAQLGQTVKGGSAARKYSVYATCNFDGDSLTVGKTTSSDPVVIEFAKGLSYILAYEANQNRVNVGDVGYVSGNDCKQLALWKYLSVFRGNKKVEDIFGEITTNAPIEGTNQAGKKYFKHADSSDVTYTPSTLAVEIYNKAIEFDGEGSFVIYLLQNNGFTYDDGTWFSQGSMQHLLLVDIATFDETVDVTLNFDKVKMDGTTKLSGAKISVEGVENVGEIINNLATTDSNSGNLGSITVNPSDLSDNTFEIKIKETTTPSGYIGINETTLTVTYNTSTGAVTNVASNNTTYVPNRTNNSTVLIKNRQVVSLKFYKRDFGTTKLGGAEIEVTGYDNTVSKFIGRNDNKTLKNTDSKTLGTFETLIIYPSHENSYAKAKNGEATLNLKVKEIKAPTGYLKMPEEVILTVTYDIYTGDVISITDKNAQNKDSVYINPTSDGKNVIVRNQPVLSSLKIIKTDSLTGNKLAGAQFKIELTGVSALANYQVPTTGESQKSPTVVYVTTNNAGEINLSGLALATNATSITATITETGVPSATGYYYKKDQTPIEFTITYNNGSWSVTGGSTTGISISSDNAEISGSNVSITVANQPYITLSGMVWEDGQRGDKVVTGPDGLKNDGNDSGLGGVLVGLKSNNQTIKTVTTGTNGTYSFIDIPYLGENNGYQIVFSYDGINWQETKSIRNNTDGDSDASEIDRATFNNRFKTISEGQSNDRTALTYTYKDEKSTLNVTMEGHTTGTEDAKFQMSAQTGTYHTTTDNIDCGLVKKEFDLAIGTDVETATLKINDKETTYNYDKILEGALTDIDIDKILQNNSSTSKEEIKYNLYLYTSDYNYRISDYKTGNEAIKNTVNPTDNTVNNYDDLKELEAYVTYSVILKNQTTYNATVDEFVYYYDSIYTPVFKEGNVIDGYKVISIENNKIIFEREEENLLSKENDYRKEVNLTFELDINSDAYKNLITTSREAKNAVEITKYSTDIGGLIDKDSAPGNGITNYEDDMDQAKGITISVGNKGTRTIAGTVFEDTKSGENKKYNGQKDNSEQFVKDVIVQLIEIKKIGEQYYEYIWQETKSGSNIVKKLSADGNSIEEVPYRETVPNDGSYAFTDFIPGNYIIRFIYGDGTTYDITSDQYKDSADNVKKYNGQDYKSTIDSNYNKLWYNTSTYSEGASVARDNEARRLEVMAYSSTINKTNGADLANKTAVALENTWMTAETSRINVPVDADNTATDLSSTVVSYGNIGNSVVFDTMNFGLALRPETKLVLEKHITGLKITPNGVGVQPIVDARINIEEILGLVEESNIEGVTGVTTGLGTIKSDRDNRGFWKVETDIEELAQGAQLEVEYTYVLRNEGEEDYLSATLVDEYKNDTNTYANYLLNIVKPEEGNLKNIIKGNTHSYGTYLGQVYYRGLNEDGTVPETDEEVSTRVETIEEALNNKLVFEEADDFIKLNTDKVSRNVYDTDGNLVDNVGSGTKNIETVVRNTSASKLLTTGSADYSKTITLRTLLSSTGNGELGINLPSYIAEITSYSNAAGRRDMEIQPENLSYVHSDDTEITMSTHNEADEFWAESIIISKPTGEDKVAPIQIVIIAISSLTVIGVGIVLIKKFVLKK